MDNFELQQKKFSQLCEQMREFFPNFMFIAATEKSDTLLWIGTDSIWCLGATSWVKSRINAIEAPIPGDNQEI